MTLANTHIVLGITGGIAAYKSADLVRQLIKQGAQVRVVMSHNAQQFITPLTLQTLSGHPVHTELFDLEAEQTMSHIELARWADHIVIAPASADMIFKVTHGAANDLLSTLCLATTAPLHIAPAMNQRMWQHPATQANIAQLRARGVDIIGPEAGEQACGDVGPGRMSEPEAIVNHLSQQLPKRPLAGVNVMITTGPTQEPIDAVRFLSNRSSGKMGYALAQAALQQGANVTLISGPTALTPPSDAQYFPVTTAQQMHQTVFDQLDTQHIVICAAAVSDYHIANPSQQKLKKTGDILTLNLNPTVDILQAIGLRSPKPFLVGFAAETDNITDNANIKRINKQLDMVIANNVNTPGIGFDSDDNAVSVLTQSEHIHFEHQPKTQLAKQLLQLIADHFQSHRVNL